MQSAFLVGNLVATAGWLLLIAGCLVPRMRTMAFKLSGLAIPALLSVAYLGLMYVVFASADAPIGVNSLDSVRALLGTPEGAVTGWFHYLAFDLFVGGWIARDAIARGLGAWWLPPVLLATFIAGPVGLIVYLAIRTVWGRRRAKEGPPADGRLGP
jgi:hypothetical protein